LLKPASSYPQYSIIHSISVLCVGSVKNYD